MPPSQNIENEHDFGFMDGVLCQARRVLFRGSEVPCNGDSTQAISQSPFVNNVTEGKKKKSRGARRVRLAASKSSLANIPSRSANMTIVGSGSLEVRIDGVGKENKVPKSLMNKRGNRQKLDSLVTSAAKDLRAELDGNKVETLHQGIYSMGSKVHVHRRNRDRLQAKDSSLSVWSRQHVNAIKTEKQQERKTKKSEIASRCGIERDESNHAGNSYAYKLNGLSSISLVDDAKSMVETESYFKETGSNNRKNRRRGRCNHPISSLVQDEVTKAQSKRSSGLSSLMALPSSTQKTQKSNPLTQKKPMQTILINSRRVIKGRSQMKMHGNSKSLQEVQPTELVNLASLSNDVGLLKIGDKQLNCSTPLTIRHRARLRGITTSPEFLHSCSTLSRSSLFSGHSPLPDLNPNLKKRFDTKRTPDKMIAFATTNTMEAAFPINRKMPKSPTLAFGPGDLNPDEGQKEKKTFIEDDVAPDINSHVSASRCIALTSSSLISSPISGHHTLAGGRFDLSSTNKIGENGCVKDEVALSDAIHVGASPRITISSPRFTSLPISRDNVNAGARWNLFSLHGNRKDTWAKDDGHPDDINHIGARPVVTKSSCSSSSSPMNGDNALLETRLKFSSLNVSNQSGNMPRTSEASKNRPGLAVIAVEVATPRFAKHEAQMKGYPDSPKVNVRPSAVIEVEIVAQTTKKESNVSSPPPRDKTEKKQNLTENVSTKKTSLLSCNHTEEKDEKDAEPPRRSLRQSRKTDRLTVISWKKKDKHISRKVRFKNSTNDDESFLVKENETGNGVAEGSAESLPFAKQSSAGKVVLDLSNQNAEGSISNNALTPEEPIAEKVNDCQWSEEELRTLRNAQKEINPTSMLYWQEVANKVGRTWQECQMKWQSMITTPKVRKRVMKKDASQPSENPHNISKSRMFDSSTLDCQEEDDFFNSSPYQGECEEDGGVNAKKFSSFGGSYLGLSPCLKQDPNSNFHQEDPSALKLRRKGYNTYIENLRKDINRNQVGKKTMVQNPNQTSNGCVTQICADLRDGESLISGKMLVDGTLNLNMHDESHDLDKMNAIWADEEDGE